MSARGEKIAAAQKQRWAELTVEERRARTAAWQYAIDTKWERRADPERLLTPEERAVAGAQLRDRHFTERGLEIDGCQ